MTERKPLSAAGTVFTNPENPKQGYRLTVDAYPGDQITPSHFEPFGGADIPELGGVIPKWLWEQLPRLSGRYSGSRLHLSMLRVSTAMSLHITG